MNGLNASEMSVDVIRRHLATPDGSVWLRVDERRKKGRTEHAAAIAKAAKGRRNE